MIQLAVTALDSVRSDPKEFRSVWGMLSRQTKESQWLLKEILLQLRQP